ncbi:hypothetical protein ACNH6B_13830 [Shewanella basaltis]|uniref:hypothetical protein n=1 Tax=Shewanella basaltis TaxID=472183 RepID=UPI003AAE6054
MFNLKIIKTYHFLRIIQVVIKFIPFLFIPNVLSIDDYASYSLITAVVTLSLFFLGLEIWYLYNRNINANLTSLGNSDVINEQLSNYLFSYLLFIPCILLYVNTINLHNGLLIIGICCFTHACQEFSRILIHLKALNYSAIISVVQASWVLVLPFGVVNDLFELLFFIFIFSVIPFFISCYFLFKLGVVINLKKIFSFNFNVFFSTIKEIKMLFLGAVFIKLGVFFPRFLLDYLDSNSFLAVLSFYQSLALVQEFFIYTLIQSKYVPILLGESDKSKKITVRKKYFKYNCISIVFLLVTGSIGSILFAYVFLDNPIYFKLYPLAIICFTSNAILCFSNYYASLLYCEKLDWSHKYSGIVCLIGTIIIMLLILPFGVEFVYLAVMFLLVFSLLLLFFRFYLWNRVSVFNCGVGL